jgi:hypothetical protein
MKLFSVRAKSQTESRPFWIICLVNVDGVKWALKVFDEGRLFLISKYSRGLSVPSWKDHGFPLDGDGRPITREGWATIEELDELAEANLISRGKQLYVVIPGGNEEWARR